ncbi:hypothetical protein [Absidia glauca]|uniref:RNA-directed DNA polymerase n=1 Tax=Absidia glauca TaxID=4829 RepID=A0A168PUD8_ABSGL|nr:hypothetical protein [Absidia glauca]
MGSVNSNNTPIVLDGGSSVDILCLDFVKALGIKELRSSSTVINVANGSSAYPVGEVESLSVSLGNRTLSIKNALVFEHLPYDCLLGRNSLHLLGATTDWSEHIWMIDWSPLEVKYTRAPTVPRNDASLESDEDGTSDEEDTDRSLDGYLICLDSVSPNNSNSDAPESFAATPDYADQDRLGDLLDQIAANNLLSTEQRVALTSLVRDNSSVFGTSYHHLSKTNLLELEVNTGEAAPIYRKPHFNLSFKEREYLKNELEQMVANGILIPSTYGANSGWSFPVRFVPKKGGDKRLVTQFMALNAVTVRDTFPLPSINDLLDQLSGASWLSALDLLKGFHQIGVHPNSIDKLTITTPFGNFSYTVMPFGIVNGPSVFSRMISMALGPLHSCALAYIDDVTVFSSSFARHLDDLARVFDRMKECKLTLNPIKCSLATTNLQLLGFTVDVSKGVMPQKDRLACLDSFPVQQTVTDVKAYLGFVGYFRRHIPCFADVAYPLSSLLPKSAAFIWTPDHDQAMSALNRLLKDAVPLRLPCASLPFQLYTDASNVAIGAALIQDSRPVAFLSRKLKQAELNYAIVEKEILAVVYAFSKFRKYLIDQHFDLFTDNNAVRYILNKAEPSARLQRWTLSLQEFTFTVSHISGKSNVVADVLSRYPPPISADISCAEESLYHGLLVMPSLYEPDLQEIFDHLQTGFSSDDIKLKRRASPFVVINHRLHKRIGLRLVLVPPLDERAAILEHIHDGHGHPGVQSTWARLYFRYWWPTSYADVKKHLGSCIPCAIFSPVARQRSLCKI